MEHVFGCFCVMSGTESFLIVCFNSEAVVCMYIISMSCRVNGNRLVPHYNSSRKLPMTKSHGGYKLFVSCIISFGQLEIGAITGEYMFPSNCRIHMVLLGKNVFPLVYEGSGIPVLKGFMVSPVIRIYGLTLSKYIYFTSLVNSGWLNIVDVVVASQMIHVMGCLVMYF